MDGKDPPKNISIKSLECARWPQSAEPPTDQKFRSELHAMKEKIEAERRKNDEEYRQALLKDFYFEC